MKKESQKTSIPNPGQTLFKYSVGYTWLAILLFAMVHGFVISALCALALSAGLTFLIIRARNNRSIQTKQTHSIQAKNYHVAENYLKIFSAEK